MILRVRYPWATLGILAVILTGCSDDAVESCWLRQPARGDRCRANRRIAPPQSSAAALVVGGDRPVTVRLPPSYDQARPAPLLIVLHGYTGSGSGQEAYFGFQHEAEGRGFVTAYPDGTKDSGGDRFWNATNACCNFDGSDVDDVGYLDGLITAIEAAVTIDPHRVYIAGHSNGGFMSYRLACAHADRIAAIVSLAGSTLAPSADCRPSEPVAILQIHGTADDTIAFSGGDDPGVPLPRRGGNGCDLGRLRRLCGRPRHPSTSGSTSMRPSRTRVSPPRRRSSAGPDCKPGGAVELWTIPGGSHVPAISDTFGAAVLGFLEASSEAVGHPQLSHITAPRSRRPDA